MFSCMLKQMNQRTNERTVPRIATTAHWPIKNSKVISYEIECGFSDDGLQAAVFDAVASPFSLSLFFLCVQRKKSRTHSHTLRLKMLQKVCFFFFYSSSLLVLFCFVHIDSSQWIYFSAFFSGSVSPSPSYGSPFSN